MNGFFTSTYNISIELQIWRTSLRSAFDREILLRMYDKTINYRVNVIASSTDISFHAFMVYSRSRTNFKHSLLKQGYMNGKRGYADKTTWAWKFYESERNFELNKISVLVSCKLVFHLKQNLEWKGIKDSWSKYLRPLQNFGKHSWKNWFWVKFRLAAYVFNKYDFSGQIFINDISIHIETSIQKCSTLLHWIVRQFDNDLLFHKTIYL